MKLLIVDDSNMIRQMIQASISKFNFETFQAGNGKEAIEIFKTEKPEIVTLDITMPEMDGLAVLEELLKINDKAQVIMITAVHDKVKSIEAMDKGAADFINKPFDPEKLEKALQRAIEQAS